MLAKLLAPVENKDAYLARIGATKPASITKEYLDYLINQHQLNVAFENVDMKALHLEPSLATEDLFDKVVTKNRGGVCFELNSLFYSLLKALGFDAYPCLCKVRLFVPSANVPSLHRATIVRLDGKLHYCDVGFGGPEPAGAVELIPDVIQEIKGVKYRFSNEDHIWILETCLFGDEFVPAMEVNVSPMNPIDFLPLMHFTCCDKQTLLNRFIEIMLLNIRLENGFASITDRTYKKMENGVETEVELINTPEMIKDVADTFHLPEEIVRQYIC